MSAPTLIGNIQAAFVIGAYMHVGYGMKSSASVIDENGKTIRYSTFYHNGFPVPSRSR